MSARAVLEGYHSPSIAETRAFLLAVHGSAPLEDVAPAVWSNVRLICREAVAALSDLDAVEPVNRRAWVRGTAKGFAWAARQPRRSRALSMCYRVLAHVLFAVLRGAS